MSDFFENDVEMALYYDTGYLDCHKGQTIQEVVDSYNVTVGSFPRKISKETYNPYKKGFLGTISSAEKADVEQCYLDALESNGIEDCGDKVILEDYSFEDGNANGLHCVLIQVSENPPKAVLSIAGTNSLPEFLTEDLALGLLGNKQSAQQKQLVEVMNRIAKDYPEYDLAIGGHSLGGFLAMYIGGVIFDDIRDCGLTPEAKEILQERVKRVDSLDGPGGPFALLEYLHNGFQKMVDNGIYHHYAASDVGLVLFQPEGTDTFYLQSHGNSIFGIKTGKHPIYNWLDPDGDGKINLNFTRITEEGCKDGINVKIFALLNMLYSEKFLLPLVLVPLAVFSLNPAAIANWLYRLSRVPYSEITRRILNGLRDKIWGNPNVYYVNAANVQQVSSGLNSVQQKVLQISAGIESVGNKMSSDIVGFALKSSLNNISEGVSLNSNNMRLLADLIDASMEQYKDVDKRVESSYQSITMCEA